MEDGIKPMGRPLSVMAHLKKSIIEVKTETNSLTHALIIAITKLNNDPDYKAYSKGRKIYSKFNRLLATTGISLDNGRGITELESFQDTFSNISSSFIPGYIVTKVCTKGVSKHRKD